MLLALLLPRGCLCCLLRWWLGLLAQTADPQARLVPCVPPRTLPQLPLVLAAERVWQLSGGTLPAAVQGLELGPPGQAQLALPRHARWAGWARLPPRTQLLCPWPPAWGSMPGQAVLAPSALALAPCALPTCHGCPPPASKTALAGQQRPVPPHPPLVVVLAWRLAQVLEGWLPRRLELALVKPVRLAPALAWLLALVLPRLLAWELPLATAPLRQPMAWPVVLALPM